MKCTAFEPLLVRCVPINFERIVEKSHESGRFTGVLGGSSKTKEHRT